MTEALLRDFLAEHPEFDFRLRDHIESTRFAAGAYDGFRLFLDRMAPGTEPAPPWAERLATFARAIADVPAYASIDTGSPEWWDSMPCIDKLAVRADPEAFVGKGYDVQRLWLRETSGTSGPRIPIWYTPEFAFQLLLFAECQIACVAGVPFDELSRRPVLSLSFAAVATARDRVWSSPGDESGLALQLVYEEGDPAAPERAAEMIRRHQPALLVMAPNILDSIVSWFEKHDEPPADGLLLITSSGADLEEEVRSRAVERLGAPVANAYGLTEVGLVASECERRDGLHLYEHDILAEVRDVDGRLRRSGSGELVVSAVANAAMPFLRYRTGDLVDIVTDPCACGRLTSRITRLSGRLVRNFQLADGTEFVPTRLNGMVQQFGLREFQTTQTAIDRIDVAVELAGGGSVDTCGLLDAIAVYVREMIGPSVEVHVAQTAFGDGGKFQRYRTLL